MAFSRSHLAFKMWVKSDEGWERGEKCRSSIFKININVNKDDWKRIKRPRGTPEITWRRKGCWHLTTEVWSQTPSDVQPNKSVCSHKWNYTSVLLPSDGVQPLSEMLLLLLLLRTIHTDLKLLWEQNKPHWEKMWTIWVFSRPVDPHLFHNGVNNTVRWSLNAPELAT